MVAVCMLPTTVRLIIFPVSPGGTAIFNEREAGIIKAGLAPDPGDGHYWDEGILAFNWSIMSIISTFAAQALSYDVHKRDWHQPGVGYGSG